MFRKLRMLKMRRNLKSVKKILTADFKPISIKVDGIPEILALLDEESKRSLYIEAKLDECDEIQLLIENTVYGIVYDFKTTNYEWFLKNIILT